MRESSVDLIRPRERHPRVLDGDVEVVDSALVGEPRLIEVRILNQDFLGATTNVAIVEKTDQVERPDRRTVAVRDRGLKGYAVADLPTVFCGNLLCGQRGRARSLEGGKIRGRNFEGKRRGPVLVGSDRNHENPLGRPLVGAAK